MKLHEKIIWYRKHQGMSQEELAEKLNVSRQAVSKWELGEATPELERILNLGKLFGISTDALLNEEDPAQPATQEEAAGETASQPGEWTSYMDGKLKGMRGLIQRKGYIAGFIVSLYGLGPLLVGLVARAGTRWMERNGAGKPLGLMDLNVQTDLNPEVARMLGMPAAARPSGPLDLFYSFGNVLIIAGVVIILGGLGLAWYLKNRSNQQIGG